jgi:tetratricopeptide (TPR) repeat protein
MTRARFLWFVVIVVVCAVETIGAQTVVSVDQAIRELREGDGFRAILTLNDVIAQESRPGGDRRIIARAHAVRAHAYLTMSQPERAQAAVGLALKADPGFVPSPVDVNAATLALFDASRGARLANPESDARAAEAAGNFQQAFLAYLAAYQALPNPPPRIDDLRLREQIIRVVQRLGTAPIVPPQAIEHVRRSDQLLQAEAVLGGSGGASSRNAAAELTHALRIAPWWPEATFKLASVQQKLQQVDEALANLNLYKLADPKGYASATAPKPAASSATPARPAPVPAPTGKATITIYRSSNFFASSQRMRVDCNGQSIAELQNGRMIRFTAPAGKVTLNFQGDDAIVLEAAPGAEYFFRSGPGGMSFNTRPVATDEAKSYLKEHKPKLNDAKRTTASECKSLLP